MEYWNTSQPNTKCLLHPLWASSLASLSLPQHEKCKKLRCAFALHAFVSVRQFAKNPEMFVLQTHREFGRKKGEINICKSQTRIYSSVPNFPATGHKTRMCLFFFCKLLAQDNCTINLRKLAHCRQLRCALMEKCNIRQNNQCLNIIKAKSL